MPAILPMLAQAGTGDPPSGPGWLHEIKWDGVRCILAYDGEVVAMRSRTGKQMSATYPELAAAALELPAPIILDGEIVTLDPAGLPSFELLQRRMNIQAPGQVAGLAQAVPVTFVVFDVLHRDVDLLDEPLDARLDRLGSISLPAGFVLSETFEDPAVLWAFAQERGLEGVVSKRRAGLYRPGVRSPDWIKSVAFKSVRAVVGGFTEGEGGRHGGFGALVLGLPDGERLRWVGSVGSGFSESDVRPIRDALDQMTVVESPFADSDQMPRGIVWVEPLLVAVVQYKQWTAAGRLRGPSFKGFTDHPLAAVTWESEGPEAPGG